MTKHKSHIKKGDLVKIISGEKKGLIGKISSIFLKDSIVFIEGLAPRIKFQKGNSKEEQKKIDLQIPIHSSNVMLWDSQAKIASRISYKVVEGKKVRYFKKSGNLV
jgi:large subunit ribosomal protein L24